MSEKDAFRKFYKQGVNFYNKGEYREALIAFGQALGIDPQNASA